MHIPRPGTLYLFLHGLWVVQESQSGLEIALPHISDHVYKAGSWLMETPILPKSELQLTGVESGTDSFANTQLMVSLKGCSLTTRGRAATLLLPRPRKILHLLHVTAPQSVLTIPPAPSKRPQLGFVVRRDTGETWNAIATVEVLLYDYKDENEVALNGHYWEPCTTGTAGPPTAGATGGVAGAISLHIIATSEGPISLTHESETHKVLKKVINGYSDLTFNEPTFPVAWVDDGDPNFGNVDPLSKPENQVVRAGNQFAFSQAELEYPAARATRLGRLGRFKQQGRRFAGLWHEGDPLDERLSNCQGIYVHVP
jgi:hypothetical protein